MDVGAKRVPRGKAILLADRALCVEKSRLSQRLDHHSIGSLSWKKPPVGPLSGSVASQTVVSAP
jgi:hypothetical protein